MGDATLVFYAQPEQKVGIYVQTIVTGFPAALRPHLAMQLDGTKIDFGDKDHDGLPDTGELMDMSRLLEQQAIQRHVHSIRVFSRDAKDHPEGYLVSKILVLVSNEEKSK